MLKYFLALIAICFFPLSISAGEDVPDDIRYMLEDMYGENKTEWPSPRYKVDLNTDGFPDWVARKKGCQLKEKCASEIFICIPNKKGLCSEYCYMEVKTLVNIEEQLTTRKCESTC